MYLIFILIFSDELRTFIEYMNNAISGESDLKWFMISAHDTNLVEIMPALNISSVECISDLFYYNKTDIYNCESFPPFASSLIIELYEVTDEYYNVKMKYNGVYQSMCDSEYKICPYNEFRQRILNYILTPE